MTANEAKIMRRGHRNAFLEKLWYFSTYHDPARVCCHPEFYVHMYALVRRPETRNRIVVLANFKIPPGILGGGVNR
jgi:hypothetical protein